jgi:4-amino-4-deoxy-L-arabinose transferase-like glycosyltransferase
MKFKKTNIIIIFLVLAGLVLRLVLLEIIPKGFFRDEAALGYNAYSIWESGKDEFGHPFPIVFRSFEVFFLPLYVYLSAPIVGIFGLSEFTTRFLSAFSGTVMLAIIYLIAKEVWSKKAALGALLVLAISPWHVIYSRGAFEGNLALTMFALGFLFWLKFIKRSSVKNFFISTIFFALSLYSYQAERLVVTLFAAVAGYLSFNKLLSTRRKLIVPVMIVFILLIPILTLSFKPGGYHRAYGVSIFSKDENPPGWLDGEEDGFFVNNRLFLRSKQFASLYASYYSPRNLFIEGDANQQRSVDNYSTFYAWMLPFMLWGVFEAVKKRSRKEKLLLTWFLLAPLPAALTGDPFHTYRSLLLFVPLSLFAGLGMAKVYETINYKRLFVLGVGAISVVSLVVFLYNYVFLTQATHARDWDYGYREIVGFINSVSDNKKVVVDDPWTEGYIHFLFFQKTDPQLYHLEVSKLGNLGDYYYTDSSEIRPNKFGKYEFRDVDWPKERGDSGTVFVMTAQRLPESEFISDPKIKLLKEIYYPDGQIAYRIVEAI